MAIKEPRGDRIFGAVVFVIVTLLMLIVLYPLIYVLSCSVSSPTAVGAGEVVLLPKGFTLMGYKRVFQEPDILLGYKNTLFYTLIGTAINLFVTVPAGYMLSKKEVPGRNLFMFLFMFTMYFSGGMIPSFLLVKSLHLYDTRAVLVILGAFSTYNCIICRSFISSSIPYELQEAARIDGCNDFQIVWRIIFPLSGPVLAILALYYALGHWNGYFNALMYIEDRNLQPLQIFLREILVLNQKIDMNADIEELEAMVARVQMAQTMKYSLIVVASVPMLIIYPFVQKFFVKGVMIGSVKG